MSETRSKKVGEWARKRPRRPYRGVGGSIIAAESKHQPAPLEWAPLLKILPGLGELSGFYSSIDQMRPHQCLRIPVLALRWTHRAVNSRLEFGRRNHHANQSIF